MPDPGLPFLAAGFGAVWLILGAYLVYLAHAQRQLSERLSELERTSAPPPADG